MISRLHPIYHLILLATLALLTCRAQEGMTSFFDDFSGDLSGWGEPVGRWHVEDGVLRPHPGVGAARLPFAEPSIGSFDLSWDIRLDKPEPSTRTYLMVNRGEGTWMITVTGTGRLIWSFIVNGRKAGLYHGDVAVPGKPGDWVTMKLVAQDKRLSLSVGGQRYLLGPAPGKGAMTLHAAGHLSIDNVRMSYDTGGRTYINRQLNGSFEHATNPDVPDYWARLGRWSRMNHGRPLTALPRDGAERYSEDWYLDRSVAFEGSQSLRIRQPSAAASHPMWLPPGVSDYTISVHLRSDRPGQRVRLAVAGADREKPHAERTVTVGPEWQRELLNLPGHDGTPVTFFVTPIDTGFLWLDAVQIEPGEQATAFGPSWYDAGFALPQMLPQVAPPESYPDRTLSITRDDSGISLAEVRLAIDDPAKPTFRLESTISSDKAATTGRLLLTTTVETIGEEPFVDTRSLSVASDAPAAVTIPSIPLPNTTLRCRVIQTVSDAEGAVLHRARRFLDVPQPLRIYPEFSHYTLEKSARIGVVCKLAEELTEGATLQLQIRLKLQRSEHFGHHTYALQPGPQRQLVELPIRGNGWVHQTPYEVVANLIDGDGETIAQATCDLISLSPRSPDIRINYLNRGLYLNGQPYLPYGVYFTWTLPDAEQLRGYRQLGFDFIGVLGHRSSIERIRTFQADCARVGLWVCMTQLSRKYGIAATDLADKLQGDPALILLNPVDETGRPAVYEPVAAAQSILPGVPSFVNENSWGYQQFSNDLRGFPGPILSCDRYPLIRQPYGWPQTATDVNGIYSVEERIEWMDRDSERDRKPLHMYLQAAEHTSREPTPTELTWLTYINLVNNCKLFTYFAGLPQSQVALDAIVQLNREVQALKPALFTVENDPEVAAANDQTASRIRVMAKRSGNELTLICVNRGMAPVEAALNLRAAGVPAGASVEVLFEGRRLQVNDAVILADRFEGLARHVYRLRLPESRP